MLVLDGIVQLSTSDEHVYHEMLVQPVMLSHPNPKRVLIVGGGDGGALREVLRHEPEQVVMVDLDEAIADLSRRHLPTLSASAFESSRLELVHQDAQVRVRSCRKIVARGSTTRHREQGRQREQSDDEFEFS